MKKKVFALHGFLGEPQDWQRTFKQIHREKPDWELHAVDILRDCGTSSSMEHWAQNFCQWVSEKGEGERVLVGYSLGGRLALHALEKAPELWKAAVFLSTNPGLPSPEEMHKRLADDANWVRRFLNEDFKIVWQDWNQQPAFTGSTTVKPPKGWQPKDIAHALTSWSLGRQKNFRLLMDLWHVRQIWAAGDKDRKFSELLKTLPASSDIQKWEVEDASHRLVHEAPGEVAHFVVRIASPIQDLFGIERK